MARMYVPPFVAKLTHAGGQLVDNREVHQALAGAKIQAQRQDSAMQSAFGDALAPPSPATGTLPFPELAIPPMVPTPALGLGPPPPPQAPPPPLPADRPPGMFTQPSNEPLP